MASTSKPLVEPSPEDAALKREWQEAVRKTRPKDALEGVTSGLATAAAGVAAGVAGLFAAPIMGAQQGGASGFAKGVATGDISAQHPTLRLWCTLLLLLPCCSALKMFPCCGAISHWPISSSASHTPRAYAVPSIHEHPTSILVQT